MILNDTRLVHICRSRLSATVILPVALTLALSPLAWGASLLSALPDDMSNINMPNINQAPAEEAHAPISIAQGKDKPAPAASKPASGVNAKNPALAHMQGPKVKIFLRDGGDITGELLAFQPNTLLLKTAKGIRPVPLQQYYGMLLATPEEIAFGEKMTRNEDAFVEAVSYTQKIRPMLEEAVAKQLSNWPEVCKPKAYPVMHFRIKRDGTLDLAQLLSKSNCPQYNLAVAQAAKQVKFPPLSKAYPFDLYVLNYFFRPEQVIKNPANKKPSPAKPADKKSPAKSSDAKSNADKTPAPKKQSAK